MPECLPIDNGGPVDRPFEPFPCSALERSISDRFDATARRFAERLAISDCARQLTYADLAILVDRIAAVISVALADRPGPVAILLPRDVLFPAAMLGVLAAGRGYVPLDASNPTERNRLIATQSGAAAVVSAGDLARHVRSLFSQDLPVVDIERIGDGVCRHPIRRPAPDDLAYIVYTSGSTGSPKGAYHSHRNLLHDVMQQTNTLHLNEEDRVALLYSPAVISAIREILMALLNGASLHILPPQELQPAGLVREIGARGITICRTVPVLLRRMAEVLGPNQRLDSVRVVGLGSQRVDWSDFDVFRRHFPAESFLIVGIGATECGGNFCHWFVDEQLRATSPRLPIGRILPDARVTVADHDGRSVADGEIGEFVVASRYVALGYWRDAELTAHAFTVDPADPKTRIFKTGDMGRLRPDGLLEYIGRRDQQIKLRGHRIELAEIERVLCSCAGVGDAAIVVRKNEANVPQSLVAYVEVRPDVHNLTPSALISILAQRLPPYRVPATIVLVDGLPRLPNLKIDRMRLFQMDGNRMARKLDPVDDPLVNEVLDIFKRVLDVSVASPEDTVASLGGDSIQSVKIAIELENRFGVAAQLFDASQTICSLARSISLQKVNQTSAAFSPFPRVDAFARYDSGKHRTDLGSTLSPGSAQRVKCRRPCPGCRSFFWKAPQAHQTVVGRYRIVGQLNVGVLRECMTFLPERHEMLRTSFVMLDGQPMQTVHATAPVSVTYFDFADVSDAKHQASLLIKEEARSIISLAQSPPLRFTLIRICADEHWLLYIGHHILFDTLSWNLYLEELALLYEAKLLERAPPLPECAAIQYVDYAAWQRQVPREPTYEQRIEWWKNLLAQKLGMPEVPFRRAKPLDGLNTEEGIVQWRIVSQVSQGLAALARQQGATYFTVVLAAYAALLSAETGGKNVVLGTHASTRDRAELHKIFGVFVNFVPIILRCETGKTFREWLAIVRARMRGIQANSVPYTQLEREMGARNVPMPAMRATIIARVPRPVLRFAGLEIAWFPIPSPAIMPPGFDLSVSEIGEENALLFDANLYDVAGVRNLVNRFSRLLSAIAQDPHLTINRLLETSAQKHMFEKKSQLV